MKLGVSYSVFEGSELLENSIRQIRDHVDYINVGYQTISFNGNKDFPELEDFLQKLKARKLIDEIFLYTPNLKYSGTRNERKKRKMGLSLAKRQKCSHFMSIDVDEFYETEKFQQAKQFIIENNIYSSAVNAMNYVKNPRYQIGFENFYFPFIFKINFLSRMKKPKKFPVQVDGSRCINNTKNFYLFPKNKIYMHHMGEVRKDIAKKIINYPINNDPKNTRTSIEENNLLLKNIELFNQPLIEENNKYFTYTRYAKKVEVTLVPNQFNIVL